MPAKKRPTSIVTRQRRAADKARREGRWETAITNYTRALAHKNLSVDVKIDLLEGRASCYRKTGNIKAEALDLKTLSTLLKSHLEEKSEVLQQSQAELGIIASIAEALVDQADYESIGRLVGQKVQEYFNAEMAWVAFYNEKSGTLDVVYARVRGELKQLPSFKYGQGVSSYVIKTRRPVSITTRKDFKKYGAIYVEEFPSKSALYAPLISGKQVLGAIAIEDSKPNAYSKHDLHILNTIAIRMAVALENARLFAETKQHNAELAVINSVQEALAKELNIQGIYEAVGEKIREIFDAQGIVLFIFDPKTNMLHPAYLSEKGKRFEAAPLPLGGFSALVKNTGKSILVNENFTEKARELGSSLNAWEVGSGLLKETRPKSYAISPIQFQGKFGGTIVVTNVDREHAFSDSDLRLLETLANSMSVALENARLFDEVQSRNREISEALGQQTATSDILRAMANSPTEIQPILDAVASNAARLCEANDVQIYSVSGDRLRQVAHFGPLPALQKGETLPLVKGLVVGRAVLERRTIHIEDARKLSKTNYPESVKLQRRLGHRTVISTPLLRKGIAIGAIAVRRDEVRPFTAKQIALLATFADQAAIAIENVRLFEQLQTRNQEITQALELQTATSDILEVIASSPEDIDSVLGIIAEKAALLLKSDDAVINYVEGDFFKARAHFGPIPFFKLGEGTRFNVETVTGRAIIEGRPIQAIHNPKGKKSEFPQGDKAAKQFGYALTCAAPLLFQGKATGAIMIRRVEPILFSEKDIALLQNFANQAVIAIEKARLLNETKRLLAETSQRNAELAVINSVQQGLASSLKFQEIIDLVGEKVGQIFSADTVTAGMYDAQRDWGLFSYYVDRGRRLHIPDGPTPRPSLTAVVVDSRQPLLIGTMEESEKLGALRRPVSEAEEDQNESILFVPILAGEKVIGAISVQSYKRNAYNQDDLRLLQTLANSMSVALENARLFDETAQRNAELAVVNGVQEAMAKRLDIKGIYEAVGEKIKDIFDAQAVILGALDHASSQVVPHFFYEKGKRLHPDPWPFTGLIEHLVSTRKTILINEDFGAKAKEFGMIVPAGEKGFTPSDLKILRSLANSRSAVYVPLVAGDRVIGGISLQNIDRENAFSDSDVRLLETLANSMTVALENARLFDETAQRNAELAVITSVQRGLASRLDFQEIIDLVGEKVGEIFHADTVIAAMYDAKRDWGLNLYYADRGRHIAFADGPVPRPGLFAQVVDTRQPIFLRTAAEGEKLGARRISPGEGEEDQNESILFVPILAGGKVIGVISVQSYQVNAFNQNDLGLLQTLANSMSVALENARLFNETGQRNAELAVINSVQEAMAKRLDIKAIHEAVGEKIKDIFNAQALILGAFDQTANLVLPYYFYEKGKRYYPEPWPFSGLIRHLITTKQTVIINQDFDARAKEFGMISVAGSDTAKSAVFVPLVTGGKVIGGITLQNIDQENAFSESDVRLLETLANSMSVALENARLFVESERLLEESREKEAELSTINTVSQAVSSELELDSLIELIGEQVRKIFRADIAYLALYDKEKDLIEFPYIFGEKLPPLKMGEGVVSRVIQEGKPLLLNRQRAWEEAERKVERVGVKSLSYLGVPILAGKRAIGAISVQSTKKEGRFNEADVHLLSTIAANVGAAIENARLFAEVARQKEYFETFFQYSPAAVVVVDFDGTVISWNPAAEGLFGYTAQEAIGRDVDNLVANDPRVEAEARAHTRKFTKELGKVEVRGRRTRKDGSFVDVEVKGLPISVEGKMVGLLVIYHDISEIEQARRAAEEANQAKSAFLANMSHELRTPLNAIIGFTRIVRRKGEGGLPEKQLENLDKVLVSAEHLLGLINTILDIAKIEAGRMELQLSSFDMVAVIDGCLATTQPLVRAEGVRLIKSLPQDLPPLHSDQEKIRQILLNLLSNAAKFTHKGSIDVGAKVSGGMISISVQDTGIGISEESLYKIFEEFQQADNTTTREYGGTGLGLSISRSLARLLGGDLTVASKEGEGSTFTLTIPMRLGSSSQESGGSKEAAAQPALEPDKPLVLVIDDHPDVFHILQQNLEEAGYQVVGALSGEEGVEKARSLHPFAITLDIMMPHKDGWQVLYELKNDLATREIPVIILTIVDNKAMGFRLGASDYLVKPLSEKAVLEALERLAKANGGVRPRKLLVVDDDPKVIDLVHQMLEGEDFVIEAAEDGAAALKFLEQHPADAILLDLLMPRLDGFQFIEEVQRTAKLREIPIIVLTAKSLSNEELSQLEKSVAKIVKKQGLGSEALIKEINKLVPEPQESP